MYRKLRDLRLSQNVSGEELAQILNLTKSTYSKKENGLIKFSLDEAKLIADRFSKKIEEIFFENKVSKIDTNIKKIVS